MKLLIADDSLLMNKVMKRVVQSLGWECTTVTSGEEAVKELTAGAFDAVLLDIHMPGMDGYQTVARIRELPTGQSLPVFALTGMHVADTKELCEKYGFTGWVLKPVEAESLKALLAPYFAHSRIR